MRGVSFSFFQIKEALLSIGNYYTNKANIIGQTLSLPLYWIFVWHAMASRQDRYLYNIYLLPSLTRMALCCVPEYKICNSLQLFEMHCTLFYINLMANNGRTSKISWGEVDKRDRCLTIYTIKRTYIKLIVCKLNFLLLTHLNRFGSLGCIGSAFIYFTQIQALIMKIVLQIAMNMN